MKPRRTVIRVGSVCTGLGTDMMAIENIVVPHGYKVRHVFACDTSNASRVWVEENFKVETWFSDISSKEFARDAKRVDVSLAGFPCQPFSSMGKGEGLRDGSGRSGVIAHILKYLRRHCPSVFLLENVPGLLSRHTETLLAIMQELRSIRSSAGVPYTTSWRVLDSQLYGAVPQHRPRLYICGVRRNNIKLHWPKPLKPVTLRSILEPRMSATKRLKYPTSPAAARKVRQVIKLLRKAGVCPLKVPVVIDCDANTCRWCIDRTPCLTATRASGGGFWVTCKNGRLSLTEMLHLQAIDPKRVTIPTSLSCNKVGHMIGNAFTQSVIERIMGKLMVQAHLLDNTADRWQQRQTHTPSYFMRCGWRSGGGR